MGPIDRVCVALFTDCGVPGEVLLPGIRQDRDPSRVGVKVLCLSDSVVRLAVGSCSGSYMKVSHAGIWSPFGKGQGS